jgi:hypothetical protein
MGRSQVVRHRFLDPAFVGSIPPAPAIFIDEQLYNQKLFVIYL